jgi:hypothetical protein
MIARFIFFRSPIGLLDIDSESEGGAGAGGDGGIGHQGRGSLSSISGPDFDEENSRLGLKRRFGVWHVLALLCCLRWLPSMLFALDDFVFYLTPLVAPSCAASKHYPLKLWSS